MAHDPDLDSPPVQPEMLMMKDHSMVLRGPLFEANVPGDLKITLEARNDVVVKTKAIRGPKNEYLGIAIFAMCARQFFVVLKGRPEVAVPVVIGEDRTIRELAVQAAFALRRDPSFPERMGLAGMFRVMNRIEVGPELPMDKTIRDVTLSRELGTDWLEFHDPNEVIS